MNLKESNSTVPSMFGLLEESNSIIYLIIFVYDIDNVMVPLESGPFVKTQAVKPRARLTTSSINLDDVY